MKQDEVVIIKEITRLAIDVNLMKVIYIVSRSNVVMYSSDKYLLNHDKMHKVKMVHLNIIQYSFCYPGWELCWGDLTLSGCQMLSKATVALPSSDRQEKENDQRFEA